MVFHNDYSIPFHGLKEGIHKYEFEVDSAFFNTFEQLEIKQGSVNFKVAIDKKTHMLAVNFALKGTVEIICDRCLEPFTLKIQNTSELFFKFSEENKEIAHDVILLSHNTHKLNLAHYMYELIVLSLPYKRIHPKGGCNSDMLCRIKGYNTVQERKKKNDPRWNKLKELKVN